MTAQYEFDPSSFPRSCIQGPDLDLHQCLFRDTDGVDKHTHLTLQKRHDFEKYLIITKWKH